MPPRWAIGNGWGILKGMNEPQQDQDRPATLPRSPEMMRAVDTALLVVDMQERLLGLISKSEGIIWNCRRLIDGAKILGVRTAVTEQNPTKLGSTAESLKSRLDSTPVFDKMAFSCGAVGGLFAGWRAEGVERILLCGIETHVCVQQTALDLLAAGYQVYVAADAVGSRSMYDYEIALRRMDSSGVTVTTTEAALFEWCERAGSDQFRQISALAKEVCLVS